MPGPARSNCLKQRQAPTSGHWIVEHIKKSITKGKKPSDIAVLTRKHKEIEKLLPYFVRADIAVQYERRDNVLDQAPIILIEQLARVLICLHLGQYKEVNAQLPQVLSHPAWGIDPISLWKLSLSAYEKRSHWLDTMALIPEFIPLQKWLVVTSLSIPHLPLESMLDILIGKFDAQVGDSEHDDEEETIALREKEFTSPLYNYFFSYE